MGISKVITQVVLISMDSCIKYLESIESISTLLYTLSVNALKNVSWSKVRNMIECVNLTSHSDTL